MAGRCSASAALVSSLPVGSVLPVGSDQFLEMEVADAKLFFRVGKECQYKAGDQARLAINLHRLHVFDPDTTHNLLWA